MPNARVKVTVVGTGYVGISNAVLLAQHNRVVALDIDSRKVDEINARRSPIADTEIEDYLANRALDLTATTDKTLAYDGADFVVVQPPDLPRRPGSCRQHRRPGPAGRP